MSGDAMPLGMGGQHMLVQLLGDLGSARLARVGSQLRFHLSFGVGEEATAIEFDMEVERATDLLKALQKVVPSGEEASATFQLNEEGLLFVSGEQRG